MSHVFGWCMGKSECANCRVVYRDWNNVVQECSCECHEGQEKPEAPPELTNPKQPIKKRVKKTQ